MRYVVVTFGNSIKQYIYKTRLDLVEGATYHIKNEYNYDYNGAVVKCIGLTTASSFAGAGTIHEIIAAECVSMPKLKLSYEIENVYENLEKGVTVVVWNDGTKTKVKCHPDDEWDREKAIYAAFTKRHYQNRGRFNRDVEKWCEILESRQMEQ